MTVKQIYEMLNRFFKEMLGDNSMMQEDLKNVIDFGKTLTIQVNKENENEEEKSKWN